MTTALALAYMTIDAYSSLSAREARIAARECGCRHCRRLAEQWDYWLNPANAPSLIPINTTATQISTGKIFPAVALFDPLSQEIVTFIHVDTHAETE